MKLCTFELARPLGAQRRLGVQSPAGYILDLTLARALTLAERGHRRADELAAALVPPDMLGFLRTGAAGLEAVRQTLDYLGARADDLSLAGPRGERVVHPLQDLRPLAPLPRPNSIRDCLAFEEHVRNSRGGEPPPPAWYEFPVYYKGNPDTVQGPGADVIWPSYTQLLDYELEFAAVIAREGVNIAREEAWDYIAGYTIFNDVSARDIQMKEMALMLGPAKGKDMDGGNVMGPFLVTPDEWDPRRDNLMVARVNGEEWSRGYSSAMYHDFAAIISYISQGETLHVGDVIGSGTVGTGCGLELRKFPKAGDLIELEIEGLGVLANRFVKV